MQVKKTTPIEWSFMKQNPSSDARAFLAKVPCSNCGGEDTAICPNDFNFGGFYSDLSVCTAVMFPPNPYPVNGMSSSLISVLHQYEMMILSICDQSLTASLQNDCMSYSFQPLWECPNLTSMEQFQRRSNKCHQYSS
jgi:hypothetical protein